MRTKEIEILGAGAREHAIGWKIKKDNPKTAVNFFPGNGGTLEIGRNYTGDFKGFTEKIRENNGLVIIGPEKYLAEGIADYLQKEGIRVFGPTRQAAELEWSKEFAQNFMQKFNIPHAQGEIFSNINDAKGYIESLDGPCVVKADGLANGKGVDVCNTKEQALSAIHKMMIEKKFGKSGETVVIQEKLEGREVSIMAFCDGKVAIPMLPARDYKRLKDYDLGPNTGGMGAYAPAWDVVSSDDLEEIKKTILQPTIEYMAELKRPYKGVLYAGIMITANGPKVLEYNCRFGDPETQVVLPLLDSNLADIADAAIGGELGNEEILWKPKSAVCVVLATEHYSQNTLWDWSQRPIYGLDQFERWPVDNLYIFHASTRKIYGKHYTNGSGRVLAITAVSDTRRQSRDEVYLRIDNPINFDDMQYRKDIAKDD